MQTFKHKEIICISYDESKNTRLHKALDTYPRLKDVYDGKVKYISDDYVTLISTFERFYKGIYIELNNYAENPLSLASLETTIEQGGHYFTAILQRINKIIKISDCDEGYYKILDRCNEIQKRYTKARFDIDYPIEEFRKDFRRLENSMYRLTKGLDELQKKSKEEELDEDVEYW